MMILISKFCAKLWEISNFKSKYRAMIMSEKKLYLPSILILLYLVLEKSETKIYINLSGTFS